MYFPAEENQLLYPRILRAPFALKDTPAYPLIASLLSYKNKARIDGKLFSSLSTSHPARHASLLRFFSLPPLSSFESRARAVYCRYFSLITVNLLCALTEMSVLRDFAANVNHAGDFTKNHISRYSHLIPPVFLYRKSRIYIKQDARSREVERCRILLHVLSGIANTP